MKAVILAGGKGRRLFPYTTVLPKPLMPINEMPILEIIIRQLSDYGFSEIYLACGHLYELIMAYCGDGSKWGVKIKYSVENTELGTIGPLALLKDRLDEPFLVMNGDILTDFNYRSFFEDHIVKGKIASIGITRRKVPLEYGVVELAKDSIINYREKPVFKYFVSMGVYIMEPYILKFIEKGKKFDIPDLIKQFIAKGIDINAFVYKGLWLDIGNKDDYEYAQKFFVRHKKKFFKNGV